MYASSVVLSNQTIVTAFGYTRPPHPSGTMAVLRWRLPPKELVDATRCNLGGTRAAAWIAIKRSAMRVIVQDVAQ